MSQMEQPRPAQAYEDYFVPAIFARWAPVLLGHARPRPGERVLDVACGTGIVARTIAPMVGSEGEVVGLDLNPQMLEVARARSTPEGPPIRWLQGEASHLPAADFDLIVCQQGLQFFPDRRGAVGAMKRVLRPGGRAVVGVWQGLDRQPVYRALFDAEARHLGTSLEETATPFMFGDPEALAQLFRDAGFAQVEVISEARDVRFPSADTFVALTILAGAAVLPQLGRLGDEDREELIRVVSDEMRSTLQEHVRGGAVVFPMHCNIAVAHA